VVVERADVVLVLVVVLIRNSLLEDMMLRNIGRGAHALARYLEPQARELCARTCGAA
jgi:hypothetical protein